MKPYKIKKSTKIQRSRFFTKLTKLVLWVLVPVLFMSGAKLEKLTSSKINEEGDYSMQISGSVNDNFCGGIDFDTSIVTTSRGISFSTLRLRLDNTDNIESHSMEFLISKENTADMLPTGTYEVLRNQEGLLNYFDGVFGFANIAALGESPLFAKSGKIKIDYLDDRTVRGNISIQMTNSLGKRVGINGDFIVIK